MTSPQQVPFDEYLDAVFASPNWLEACVSMLAAFLESIDSCRDSPGLSLPQIAPPIVDQVSAVADRAQRLVHAIGILLGSRGLAGRSAHEGIQQEMDAVIQLLVGDDRRVTDIQLVLQRQHSYVEVVVSALFIATISPSCHSGASASSSRSRCDILSVSGSFAFAL